jgi:hypothetical protein
VWISSAKAVSGGRRTEAASLLRLEKSGISGLAGEFSRHSLAIDGQIE